MIKHAKESPVLEEAEREMNLERQQQQDVIAIAAAHRKTQSSIDSRARNRHLKSSGRWEDEPGLAEILEDLRARITVLEEQVNANRQAE